MRPKLMISMALSLLVMVSLSCSLLSNSNPPPASTSGEPQATKVLAATGAPDDKEADKDADKDADEPSAQPTSLSGFTGGISAQAGYALALPKALEWSPNAILSRINSSTINRDGLSQSWTYLFADDTLKTAADRSQGYFVNVSEDGVKEAKPANINIFDDVLLQSDLADWKIDAGQAQAACDPLDTSGLIVSNPAVYVNADLVAYDTPPVNTDAPRTTGNIIWNIIYSLEGKGGVMYCAVDGTTGQPFTFNIDRSEIPTENKVSALTTFKTALAKAQAWNPAATLSAARPDCSSEGEPSLAEGLAICWRYTFIVLPEPEEGDYQPSFDVTASSIGLVNFRSGSAYAGHIANGLQEDWKIDSSDAYRIAEENGGKAFREQYPAAQFEAALEFTWNPVNDLNTAKNIRWEAAYSIPGDYDHELTLWIDATTGEVVYKR